MEMKRSSNLQYSGANMNFSKGLLQSEALKQYIFETSVYPREHPQLRELREATLEKYADLSKISVPVDEGMFLSMIVAIMNAKNTLEIGVFTGYSLLATALGLPDDAQITAIDKNQEAFDLGFPFMKKAGMDHKINFIQSDATSALSEILASGEHDSGFDFAFIDADKPNYKQYHEQVLKLVKIGGIIAYDNTLWCGSVAEEEGEMPHDFNVYRKAIMEFNVHLCSDYRVSISQVSIADGVTLCRRVR